jgi:hypothetical protein
MSVFHALQLGHLPNHLAVMPPQSVQVYWVFSLAICQYYWIDSQYEADLTLTSLLNSISFVLF